MIHLPINLETFGFVQREKNNGVTVIYKCQRDFLYYALHYFFPALFNQENNNPKQIEEKGLFGLPVPYLLAWTNFQVYKVPSILKKYSLHLFINKREIRSYIGLVFSLLFSRISYEEAIEIVEKDIQEHNVVAIDIAFKFQGLEDHILFVYGYDEYNLHLRLYHIWLRLLQSAM